VAREVATGDTRDGRTLIKQGLHPGDLVIVEGQDRVQPNATVKAMPWRATSNAATKR